MAEDKNNSLSALAFQMKETDAKIDALLKETENLSDKAADLASRAASAIEREMEVSSK